MKKNHKIFGLNKRADIPITILVIGVLLLCGIAIFSFSFSLTKVRNSFVGINLIEKINLQIEEKIFNNEDPTGLHFEKNTTEGFLFWVKEVPLFSVEYKGAP